MNWLLDLSPRLESTWPSSEPLNITTTRSRSAFSSLGRPPLFFIVGLRAGFEPVSALVLIAPKLAWGLLIRFHYVHLYEKGGVEIGIIYFTNANPFLKIPMQHVKPPKKIPVTLIVGMICKRAIVLAADSQTSYGLTKIPGTNKITVVTLQNGKEVLVAESGMVVPSGQVVSIFSDKAALATVESRDTIPELMRASMMETRKKQIELYPSGHSLEEWKTLFRDQIPVELTVAYYYGDTPYLFTISLDECICRFVTTFSTSGIGRDLGNYLFDQYFAPEMAPDLGLAIGIKITRDASAYVEGCGLPIKAAIIEQASGDIFCDQFSLKPSASLFNINSYRPERTRILSASEISSMTKIVEKTESVTAQSRTKYMHKAILAEGHKEFNKMFPKSKGWNRLPKK